MEEETSTPRAEGPPEETIQQYGCTHYKRKSKFVSPCCNKIYVCRFCHDENESHHIKRREIKEVICAVCDAKQSIQEQCQNCNAIFGRYTCLKCNLFDDEDKNQFHCDGCGICRIGGATRFFHCDICNMCLPLQIKGAHKCVENVSRSNCPVCLEDIHTSRIPCHIPPCGHLLHRTCFEQLLSFGLYACPVCQTSLMNMERLWKYWDMEVANTPMPSEYRNYYVQILCKDCHKEGSVKFHVVGFKCLHCGSYNTCRVKGAVSVAGYCRSIIRYIALFCNIVMSSSRYLFSQLSEFLFMNIGLERNLENMALDHSQGEGSNYNSNSNQDPLLEENNSSNSSSQELSRE